MSHAHMSRKKTTFAWIFGTVLTVFVVIPGVGYWWWFRVVSDVRYFAPPDWESLSKNPRVDLMVFPDRKEMILRAIKTSGPINPYSHEPMNPPGSTDREFLERLRQERDFTSSIGDYLDPEFRGVHYLRYDPDRHELSSATEAEWDRSSGRVTRCFFKGTVVAFIYYDLLFGNSSSESVKQAGVLGKTTVSSTVSPFLQACSLSTDRQSLEERRAYCRECVADIDARIPGFSSTAMVAVVSAKAEIQPFPFIYGHYVPGSRRQHYHQIFTIPDLKPVGKALRLPMVTRWDHPRPGRDWLRAVGWSADNRFVVYVGETSLCIVHVETE